jgi:hypothetical protein
VDGRDKPGHDVLGLQNANYYNRIRSRTALQGLGKAEALSFTQS